MAEVMILRNTDFEGIAIRYQFSQMAAEDTVDLETAREMLHQTIREVYAEP